MDIVNAVLNVASTISNWFWILINRIVSIWNGFVNVFSYIITLFKTLFYWLTSLLSSLWNLISQVFQWEVLSTVSDTFIKLSEYIWTPATIFMASLLFIIFVRIVIAFVFKILRLNIDYYSLTSRIRTWQQHSKK